MIKRNTIQATLVYEAVNRLQCHATAEEIYSEIAKDYPTISRGTVYRNLNRLAQMGKIRRMEIPGGPERFDHLCRPHYHVRCEGCGRVFDVEMDYIPGLEAGIKDPHGFRFTGHDIIFRGICPQCAERGEPSDTGEENNPLTIKEKNEKEK